MEEESIKSFDDLLKTIDTPNSKNIKKHKKFFKMGQLTTIQVFKYDGTLYRQYEGAKIVANLTDFVVVLLMKTKVSEKSINWVVSEPILFFFARNKFYNASITLNKSKENYIYINLASPFYIENEVIKYIDFDIDIKSYDDKDFSVIDWQDFKNSISQYNYSLKLIYKLYEELDFLYEQKQKGTGVFSKKLVNDLEKMLRESGDI
ncbi:DUF402 domain-containing protein [Metamycoplasma hominis]|uniref:DUF402 domain-containing protein n=1 Tax=Metamycoplasma hominis TaxID=2098 RepID=UPI001F189E40|nr:DUF402 domain-containing protein [Metamycoplasma hominis]